MQWRFPDTLVVAGDSITTPLVLQEELEDDSGDPVYPKLDFPTARDCPQCRKAGGRQWAVPEVVSFLTQFYGPEARASATTVAASKKQAYSSSTGFPDLESGDQNAENSAQAREVDSGGSSAQKHSDGVDGWVGANKMGGNPSGPQMRTLRGFYSLDAVRSGVHEVHRRN